MGSRATWAGHGWLVSSWQQTVFATWCIHGQCPLLSKAGQVFPSPEFCLLWLGNCIGECSQAEKAPLSVLWFLTFNYLISPFLQSERKWNYIMHHVALEKHWLFLIEPLVTATIEAFLVSHRILDPPNKAECPWSEDLQWRTKRTKFLLCHPQHLPKGNLYLASLAKYSLLLSCFWGGGRSLKSYFPFWNSRWFPLLSIFFNSLPILLHII